MGDAVLVYWGVTSYIDLLTYPLVTLGVPLILWLSLREKMDSIRSRLAHILILSVLWALGYGGIWAGKWILGSVITGEDIIGNAFEQIQWRSSPFLSKDSSKMLTYRTVIERVLEYSQKYIIMAAIVALAYFCMFKLRHIRNLKLGSFLIYAVIGIYPFSWYFILKNHTYIHAFFTYREMAITVYALMASVATCKNY